MTNGKTTMFDKNQLPDIEAREKKAALYEVWMNATDETAEAAQDAYEAFDAPGIAEDANGGALRCAMCGAPIFEGDETVEDWKTDEVFLRVAIGLPPRPSEEQVLPDMEDVA